MSDIKALIEKNNELLYGKKESKLDTQIKIHEGLQEKDTPTTLESLKIQLDKIQEELTQLRQENTDLKKRESNILDLIEKYLRSVL